MFIRFGGLVSLLAIAVWLWAIFDSITAPADRIRLLPKAVWVILVLLFADLGAIAWFVLGRPRAQSGTGASVPQRTIGRLGPGASNAPPVRRSLAPDDDPEFLRRLGDQTRRDRPAGGDDPTG
jgi:Phospholipase_D-nuclease N-terminal